MMQIKANNQLIDWPQLPHNIHHALTKGYSIAMWRKPSEKGINLMAGEAAELPLEEIHQQGFLIAPFINHGKAFFISPADDYLSDGQNDNTGKLPWHLKEGNDESTTEQAFKKKVRFAVEQIKGGAFDKVVVSREKVIQMEDEIALLDTFQQLCDAYPEAFIYLISTPKYGTWIGATPELLLGFSENQLQTVALAGTVSSPDSEFSEKDEQEHQFVEKYIQECFEDQQLELIKKGPKKINAGHLTHLRSDYSTEIKSANTDWRSFIKQLHPTPAVGGYTKEITQIFIRNEEGFDRELYTGFLGPLYDDETGELYVNLRCMQLQQNAAVLYAGTGIVRNSRAPQEWEETSQKLAVLEKVLEQHGLLSAE